VASQVLRNGFPGIWNRKFPHSEKTTYQALAIDLPNFRVNKCRGKVSLEMIMRGTLLLSVLNIKSSYSEKLEIVLEDSQSIPDTIQWWFGTNGCWRIRTYAIDHDIHVYKIGDSPQTTLEMANKNNLKNYGDLIKVQHVVRIVDCSDRSELEKEFGKIRLVANMEISGDGFAFWKPDDDAYWTKSMPVQETAQ
jgi:hypothetical protein